MIKIGFIGGGNMAGAMIKGLCKTKEYRVFISEKKDERRKILRKLFKGIEVYNDNKRLVRENDLIILACKPQDIKDVCTQIKNVNKKDKLFLSILAGVTTASIYNMMGDGCRIVRAMPNSPALIGKGITALAKGVNATHRDLNISRKLMSSVGEVVIVGEEDINWVTAISGSGPAYCFYLMESMIEAGKDSGISQEIIRKLVLNTLSGASELALRSDKDIIELRQMVTSKRGTTESAIKYFQRKRLKNIIKQGIKRAKKRADELGT
ncbi:MAG: pyrroline-5-carboxylate reductase [Candidatus Hydrogenedentota bacterium]